MNSKQSELNQFCFMSPTQTSDTGHLMNQLSRVCQAEVETIQFTLMGLLFCTRFTGMKGMGMPDLPGLDEETFARFAREAQRDKSRGSSGARGGNECMKIT